MVAWLHSKIETITGAAAILAAASLASKLLGLARNRILAGLFGAGDTLDAYYAAFRIPDAIFQFVVLGALSAGFIPVFVELMERASRRHPEERSDEGSRPNVRNLHSQEIPRIARNGIDTHWHVASSVLNALLLLLLVLLVLFMIFAPQIQALITPGFSGEKLITSVMLARIMALGPIFLGISAVLSGILQAYKRFYIYALAPLFYNLGIIVGAWFLVPRLGAAGLAIGVVSGAVMHMLAQVPTAYRMGFHWKAVCNLKDRSVRKIAALSVPRMLGLAVAQINFFVITILASKLSSGSLSVFNLANDIQNVPIGLFGISVATAAFPAFSLFAARGDRQEFKKNFSSTTRLILFLTVPFTVLLLLLRAQITRVLLGWGEFSWANTIDTADTLAFFSISLFAQALLPLFARALYAFKDTLSPLIAGAVGVVLNAVLAMRFGAQFGVSGLALAFSLSSIVNTALLWIILRARFGGLEDFELLRALAKFTAAALAMTIVVQAMKFTMAAYVNMQTGLGIFTQGFVAGVLGLLVFVLIALAMGSQEAEQMKNVFVKRLFRDKDARPVEIME